MFRMNVFVCTLAAPSRKRGCGQSHPDKKKKLEGREKSLKPVALAKRMPLSTPASEPEAMADPSPAKASECTWPMLAQSELPKELLGPRTPLCQKTPKQALERRPNERHVGFAGPKWPLLVTPSA